jgi:hypothetical protein
LKVVDTGYCEHGHQVEYDRSIYCSPAPTHKKKRDATQVH